MKEKDRQIFDRISEKFMLDDLRCLLDEELAKDPEERDYDYIKEVTAAITEIFSGEDVPEPPVEDILREAKARSRREKFSIFSKFAAAVGLCLVIGAVMNVYTLMTFGSDPASTVYKAGKNGFSLDLSAEDPLPPSVVTTTVSDIPDQPTTIPVVTTLSATTSVEQSSLITTDMDCTTTASEESTNSTATTTTSVANATHTGSPGTTTTTAAMSRVTEPLDKCDDNSRYYAAVILETCAQYDIEPYYPQTMPDEDTLELMLLTDTYYEKMEDSEDFYFTFENSSSQLEIIIEKYSSRDEMPEVLIPSDVYNVSTTSNEYFTIYVFSEGNHDTVIFVRDDIVYTIYTYNLGGGIAESIAKGFGPSGEK